MSESIATFQKRRPNKLSVLRELVLPLIVAVIMLTLALTSDFLLVQIAGWVVGGGVLLFYGVAIALVMKTDYKMPLELGTDYIAFEKQRIYAKDTSKVDVVENDVELSLDRYPLKIKTSYGEFMLNLADYGIKTERLGQVADTITKILSGKVT